MKISPVLEKISGKYGGLCIKNCNLSQYSTIGTGGTASVLYIPSSESELEDVLKVIKGEEVKSFISGNGSNVLFSDKGFDGVVVRINGDLVPIKREGERIEVSSGTRLSKLLQECMAVGLSGLECMAGIPATVGGAIKNNASSDLGAITDVLEEMIVLTEDKKRVCVNKKEIKRSYRSSLWPGGGVILRAVFTLKESSPEDVRKRVKDLFMKKLQKQPCNMKTLGCVFKNPGNTDKAAWQLVDAAGMRGRRLGGARVSEKHANFIINDRKAKSFDVAELIQIIRGEVRNKFGIELENEIEMIGG